MITPDLHQEPPQEEKSPDAIPEALEGFSGIAERQLESKGRISVPQWNGKRIPAGTAVVPMQIVAEREGTIEQPPIVLLFLRSALQRRFKSVGGSAPLSGRTH